MREDIGHKDAAAWQLRRSSNTRFAYKSCIIYFCRESDKEGERERERE